MNSRITSDQAVRWINSLRKNLNQHRRRRKVTNDERLAFLSDQYQSLYLLNHAIDGKVLFVGATPIGENDVAK